MELLTQEMRNELPPLYSQELVEDPMVVAKFFGGSWTWYVTEGSPVDDEGAAIPRSQPDAQEADFLFFGLVQGLENELGYFSLAELQGVRMPPFGLGIERDLYWQPRPLSKVREAVDAGRIAT